MPRVREARPSLKPVRYSVRLPQADEVAITGDFTGWDPSGIPLHHGGTDEWYATLNLSPGIHEYRLRVDGEWCDDPAAVRRIRNPFGTENSVLIVGPADGLI